MSLAELDTAGFASPEMAAFPNIVNIEVFRGACPCSCAHCPVGATPPSGRRGRFGLRSMEPELWDRITREIGSYPWSVARVHSVGEPVLWAGLPDALRRARQNRCHTWVFTSLVTRDEGMIEALADHASIIEVSVNSISAADYRATKGVDAFARVTANLAVLRSRRAAGRPARLIVSRVESRDRGADREFVRFWQASGLVDDAFVRRYHSYNGLLPEPGCGPAGGAPGPCLVHWARCNIGVDGRVVVCFNELFRSGAGEASALGDVTRSTIAAVWRGPAMHALREASLSGGYTALACGDSLPCKTCRSFQPLRTPGQTSECQLRELRERG